MSARLDVVTGYLGAGKTTFIEKYITYLKENCITFAVIENEFGRAGIDAECLRATGAEILEISGGCVCCTLKVTLYEMLEKLSGEVDRIILEPSGLFCGDDLLDIVNTPALDIEPGFWLGVVDPYMTDRLNFDEMDVLLSELIYAGAIYISKTDICTESQAHYTEEKVRELFCEVSPEFFRADHPDFSVLLKTSYILRQHEREQYDHASMYMSATVSPKRSYTEGELAERRKGHYKDFFG